MKIGIINLGMGNLGSVRRAFINLGVDVLIADDPNALQSVNRIVLPGVGGFSEGSMRLRENGWDEEIHRQVDRGKPLLGICLGMQLLSTSGEEGGYSRGLNLIPGKIRRLDDLGCSHLIPHVGWNDITMRVQHPLLTHIPSGTDFYFVHSYALQTDGGQHLLATTEYGIEVAAVAASGHVFGTQFHPEKSSRAGRRLLQNFLDISSC